MRRLIVVLVGLVFLLCGLAACQSGPGQVIHITFYKRGYVEGGTDSASVTLIEAVQVFEKNHPNIKVKIVGIPWTQEGTQQLEDALAAGKDIHVFSVSVVDLARYARLGYISNLEPYMTADDRDDFYASGLQAVTVNGKIYAWPLWVTAVSVFANKDIFDERGVTLPTLEDPWTWDEFVAAARQLTYQRADGTQVYGFTAPSNPGTVAYYPLMYMDGGRMLSPDGRRFVQNEPESISALQKIVDMIFVENVIPPGFGSTDQAAAREQFKARTVAMLMETPGFLPDLEKSNFPVVILPPPVGAAGNIVTTGAFGMYGVANVSDPDQLKAAHELARYLTGSQVAKDVSGYQLAPGLRRSNTSYATTPNRELIARLVSFGLYEAPVSVSPEVRNQYDLTLQAVVMREKTPQEAMDEIAPIYQAELDQQQK